MFADVNGRIAWEVTGTTYWGPRMGLPRSFSIRGNVLYTWSVNLVSKWTSLCQLDGLMQNRRNFGVLAMELHLFCIEPSNIYNIIYIYIHTQSTHWFAGLMTSFKHILEWNIYVYRLYDKVIQCYKNNHYWVSMVLADGLVPVWHQAIRNHHDDIGQMGHIWGNPK